MTYFGSDFFEFFEELRVNNNRPWFKANKKRYERSVKEPALRFIAEFATPLAGISEHFQAIPKASGGSLFRIYRDTRFSADKTPYKTTAGIHFRHESARNAHTPGFYLHLAAGDCGAGHGIWMPDTKTLTKIRQRIVDRPDEWKEIRGEMVEQRMEFMGESLKRAPKGFDKDHEHIVDLRRKSLAVVDRFTDEQVAADDFLKLYEASSRKAVPLVRFICDALNLPF